MKKYQLKDVLKVAGVSLLALCVVLLTGCGGTDNPSSSDEPSINISKTEKGDPVDDGGSSNNSHHSNDDAPEDIPFGVETFVVSEAEVAFDVFSDGQIAYITADVTNLSTLAGEDGTLEFVLLDKNDNIVASEVVDAPVLFPGTFTVADFLLDDTLTGTHAEVWVHCTDSVEVGAGPVEVADCNYSYVEDNGDGTMTIHWDEEYTAIPEGEDPDVMNTFVLRDSDGNLVCACYCIGGCFGENGEIGNVYFGGCPAHDFFTAEIHCYLMD